MWPTLPPWPLFLSPPYQVATIRSSAPAIRSFPQDAFRVLPSPQAVTFFSHTFFQDSDPLSPSVYVCPFVNDAVLTLPSSLDSPPLRWEAQGCAPLGITGTCLRVWAESALGTLFV